MAERNSSFDGAIRSAGLVPPDRIEPGRVVRFPGHGKAKGNTAAWCILFADRRAGCFGDWSTGVFETWRLDQDRRFTRGERVALEREVQAARALAQQDLRLRQAIAAGKAQRIWSVAVSAPGCHPYLVRKAIRPHGARLYRGSLTLPVVDFSGELTSL